MTDEEYATREEIENLLDIVNELKNEVKSLKENLEFKLRYGIESEEDLYSPSKLYAVRFDEENRRGAYLLLTQTQGVGLDGGILVVRKKDLQILDRAGINCEKYELKTNKVSEIYEHFGIEIPKPEKPSLFERILDFFYDKLRL